MTESPQLNVLLVDDSPDDVFFFKRALRKTGVPANLMVSEDGQAAIHWLRQRGNGDAPDLVFLDLKMPGTNGFQVMEWIRQNSTEMLAKVIILSGSEEPEDITRARQFGIRDYLTKPIRPEKLVPLLQKTS